MGLSAGTRGGGNPGGSRQENPAAARRKARARWKSWKRRSPVALPARGSVRIRERRGLGGELLALGHPLSEVLERRRIDAGWIGLPLLDVPLHRGGELVGALAVRVEEKHVRGLHVIEAVEAEIGFGAIFDRGRVGLLQGESLVVRLERGRIVACLAVRVTEAAPRLEHLRVVRDRLQVFLDRRFVLALALSEQLRLLC